MDLVKVLAALYDSEINCGIKSFWDAGWHVWIGDESNGIKIETGLDDVSQAAEWLDREARLLYPGSDYANG